MPLTRLGPFTSSRAMTRAVDIARARLLEVDEAAGGARACAGVDDPLNAIPGPQVHRRGLAALDAGEEVLELVHVHAVVGGLEAPGLPLAGPVVVAAHRMAL